MRLLLVSVAFLFLPSNVEAFELSDFITSNLDSKWDAAFETKKQGRDLDRTASRRSGRWPPPKSWISFFSFNQSVSEFMYQAPIDWVYVEDHAVTVTNWVWSYFYTRVPYKWRGGYDWCGGIYCGFGGCYRSHDRQNALLPSLANSIDFVITNVDDKSWVAMQEVAIEADVKNIFENRYAAALMEARALPRSTKFCTSADGKVQLHSRPAFPVWQRILALQFIRDVQIDDIVKLFKRNGRETRRLPG